MLAIDTMNLTQSRGKIYEFMSAQLAQSPSAELLALLAEWASEAGSDEQLSAAMTDALRAVDALRPDRTVRPGVGLGDLADRAVADELDLVPLARRVDATRHGHHLDYGGF